MSAPPARVALVGCGAVAALYYAPALGALERHGALRVVALLDPDRASLERLGRQFPAARRPERLEQITAADADLAIVASPPRFHSPQTVQLLGAGLSVLCEKPMAPSLPEAEAMVAAAESAPGVLAVGLFRRFFPASRLVRQALAQGLIGDVTSFSLAEGGVFRWPVQSPAYFQRDTARGGVLIDVGAHLLDLLIWWLGEPAEVAYEDDAMGGVEANCRLRCRMPGGATGVVRLSRDTDLPGGYVIRGTRGWLRAEPNEADRVQLGVSGAEVALDGRLHLVGGAGPLPALGRPADTFEQSFMRQVLHVIAAMRGEEPVLVSGAEALRGLRLIARCYRGRALMDMPWLGEPERARAAALNQADPLW